MAITVSRARVKSRRTSLKKKRIARRLMGDSMAFAREGMLAWGRILEERERTKLATLEDGSVPASHLDTDAPWWCMALSTEPAFLKPEERSECEMLMGLCPKGSSGIDWHGVCLRAPELFDTWAEQAKSRTRLHLAPFDIEEDGSIDPAGPRHIRLGGRCYIAMPGFEDPDFFESLSMDKKSFDRRRAKRRKGSEAPISWSALHGDRHARDLWLSGFSPSQTTSARFDEWAAAVQALACAMLECGASRVERVAGFFERLPMSMDAENLAPIDAGRLDPLRQSWDIESAAAPAPTAKRKSSL